MAAVVMTGGEYLMVDCYDDDAHDACGIMITNDDDDDDPF
jgi:hypothetical protein